MAQRTFFSLHLLMKRCNGVAVYNLSGATFLPVPLNELSFFAEQ
jgi:hypothetical protein